MPQASSSKSSESVIYYVLATLIVILGVITMYFGGDQFVSRCFIANQTGGVQAAEGKWVRHERCQYKENTFELLETEGGRWCLLIVEGDVTECLKRCRQISGCEAVNIVPLTNPPKVYFDNDYNIPQRTECERRALIKEAIRVSPGGDSTAVGVCYGFKLKGDYEVKAEAHTISRDPEDPIAYSSCHRFQGTDELAKWEAIEASTVKAHTERLWTAHQLSLFGASRAHHNQILLAILGEVFDVTRGKAYYGANGSYRIFAGRDGSRAFATGEFTEQGAKDSLDGLTSAQVHEVVGWSKFYSREYIPVGNLIGRYYDSQGQRTLEWAALVDWVNQHNASSTTPLYFALQP